MEDLLVNGIKIKIVVFISLLLIVSYFQKNKANFVSLKFVNKLRVVKISKQEGKKIKVNGS